MSSFPSFPSHLPARNIKPKPKNPNHRLETVGKEAFQLLEKLLEQPVIDCNEAAKKYGGVIVTGPVLPKEQPRPRNAPRKLPRWSF